MVEKQREQRFIVGPVTQQSALAESHKNLEIAFSTRLQSDMGKMHTPLTPDTQYALCAHTSAKEKFSRGSITSDVLKITIIK